MGYIDDPIPMLRELVTDSSKFGSVLEGILACGFVPSGTAAGVALMAAEYEMDEWMEHVLKDTLGALRNLMANPILRRVVSRTHAGRCPTMNYLREEPLGLEFTAPPRSSNRLTIPEEKRDEALVVVRQRRMG